MRVDLSVCLSNFGIPKVVGGSHLDCLMIDLTSWFHSICL